MSMDPNRWINTLPITSTEFNQEKYKLDSNRWIKTLPKKEDKILILSNETNSNSKSSSGKKYSLTIILFVVGLILVSVIKNKTRSLQKEISNLHASINTFNYVFIRHLIFTLYKKKPNRTHFTLNPDKLD